MNFSCRKTCLKFSVLIAIQNIRCFLGIYDIAVPKIYIFRQGNQSRIYLFSWGSLKMDSSYIK